MDMNRRPTDFERAPEPEPVKPTEDEPINQVGPSKWIGPAVSRDPVYYLKTFSGRRDDELAPESPIERHDRLQGVARPYRGLRGVEELGRRIRDAHSRLGARRFWLNRPGGTTKGAHVGAGQWLSILFEKRQALVALFEDLRVEIPDLEIIPFVGSTFNTAHPVDKAAGWSSVDAEASCFVPGQTQEHNYIGAQSNPDITLAELAFFPWLDNTPGPSAIDAASSVGVDTKHGPYPKREHFVRMSRALNRYNPSKYLIGEALPLNGDGTLDLDAISRMPWVAVKGWYDGRHEPGHPRYIKARLPGVHFNYQTTRLFVWHVNKEDYSTVVNPHAPKAMMQDEFLRGLIPITDNDEHFTWYKEQNDKLVAHHRNGVL